LALAAWRGLVSVAVRGAGISGAAVATTGLETIAAFAEVTTRTCRIGRPSSRVAQSGEM
jgi:hypothetical protein